MDEVRTKGVVGNAVVFDGENDYLELPSILIPTGSEQLTISFWTYGNFASLKNSTLLNQVLLWAGT